MNENGITVLSLFDGMSCGRIALKELGIKVDKYYASEIDKHAIKQTTLNFPDTVQLGSVTDVDARKLGHIDLLCGGSPCTNFSFAGRRNGNRVEDRTRPLVTGSKTGTTQLRKPDYAELV